MAEGVAPSEGVNFSAGKGVVSPTPSTGVPSLGTGSAEGVGVLVGALCAAGGAGVANTASAPSKKPSIGTPMEAEISSAVGRYTNRGLGSS